jgi:hypothetical protein
MDEISAKIAFAQTGKEDALLKHAAVTFLYEECGQLPAIIDGEIEPCAEEVKQTVHSEANSQMHTARITNDEVLFDYILNRINNNNKVVGAEVVPLLLNRALADRKMAAPLLSACGETGKWLCKLNKNWQILLASDAENTDWETGSPEGRKEYFKQIREQNPSEALQLLQQIFEQENANVRAEFISLLFINLSLNDELFLEETLKDKSKKVKEHAQNLLRLLQGSAINSLYLNYLAEAFTIREERVMIISKKRVLQINNVAPTEEIFKSGIDKVSSEKGVEDHIYWIAQMLSFVSTKLLAQKLNTGEDEFLKLLLDQKQAKTLLPYLTSNAINLENKALALKLLQQENVSDLKLLLLLESHERTAFYEKFIESHIREVVEMLQDEDYTMIDKKLAQQIIKKLSADPYQITQAMYARMALQLPAEITKLLQDFANEETADYQRRFFAGQAANMLRYIELRDTLHF